MPLWEDDCKGCTDTASAGLNDLVGLIQNPGNEEKPGGNIGKSYRSVIGTRPVRVTNLVYNGVFIFSAHGNVFNHAIAAADERRSSKAERQHFARYYLEPFAAYFAPKSFLPLLFNYCNQDASAARALQKVFEEFKQHVMAENQGEVIEEPEVQNWFWDVEKIPPAFEHKNARRLFAYCGVVVPLT